MTDAMRLQSIGIDTDDPDQRSAYLRVVLQLNSHMISHLVVPAFMAIHLHSDGAKLGFNGVQTALNCVEALIHLVSIRLLRQLSLDRVKAPIHVGVELCKLFLELIFRHNYSHFMTNSIALQGYSLTFPH